LFKTPNKPASQIRHVERNTKQTRFADSPFREEHFSQISSKSEVVKIFGEIFCLSRILIKFGQNVPLETASLPSRFVSGFEQLNPDFDKTLLLKCVAVKLKKHLKKQIKLFKMPFVELGLSLSC